MEPAGPKSRGAQRRRPTEHVRYANASQVLEVLMNTFGLDVGGIGDVHDRITEVLDA